MTTTWRIRVGATSSGAPTPSERLKSFLRFFGGVGRGVSATVWVALLMAGSLREMERARGGRTDPAPSVLRQDEDADLMESDIDLSASCTLLLPFMAA